MSVQSLTDSRVHQRGAEFAIQLDYQRHSESPARVFKAMSDLIEAFQDIDRNLLRSISNRIEPVLLLEDIEAGSLRAWLRNALELADDEALKSGDWKKVVGAYLVQAKRIMIEFLGERTTIDAPGEIQDLQRRLVDAATETDALQIPAYQPMPPSRIANSVRLLADAVTPLKPGDSAKYISGGEIREINLTFRITPESLEALLVNETYVNDAVMILRVKRPDFLGEAMWEFRHEGRTFPAKITDTGWMVRFRLGGVELRPGDAIRAVVKSTVQYGHDGDVVNAHHEVTQVLGVIRSDGSRQSELL